MENFRIDFTLSNPFPDGCRLGECGEKNAVQLIITPPEDLAAREEIRSYVVAFSTEKGPVRYGPFTKSDTVTVPVGKALTVGTALSVQLEGYDANGEFIIKSRVLSGILISNSIRDCECSDGSDNDDFVPPHVHDNFDVLSGLSDEDGILKYNEKKISGEKEYKTVVLKTSDSSFLTAVDVPDVNTVSFFSFNNSNCYVPSGAQIIGIEINIASEENPEWIDLVNLNTTESFTLHFIRYYKTVYFTDFGGMLLATIYYPYNKDVIYDKLANYGVYSIRVKYIESGETE